MKGITLLGLIALAPMAQAAPIVNGRDLNPPVEFFDASSRELGAPVYLVMPVNPAGVYEGAAMVGYSVPSPAPVTLLRHYPSLEQPAGRVLPFSDSAGGQPGWDAGSFGYGDDN